jgi:O-antigen ligase
MTILAPIFALALLTWGIVLLRTRPVLPAAVPAWLVITSFITSIVAGYFFWHRDIGPIPISIDRAALGIAGGVWAYGWLLGRYQLPRLVPLDGLVALWLAVIILSTALTDYRFRENLPITRLLFFNVVPVATYVLLRISPLSRQHYRGLLWVLVFLGLYLGLTGVAEWRRWNALIFPRYIASPAFEEFYGRGRGPLLNPVINGMILSLCGTACLLLLPTARVRHRLVLLVAFGVIGLGVLSTLTRSCWIGFAGSTFLVCLAPLNWRQRFVVTLATGLVGVAGLAALSSQLNRFKRDEFVTAAEMSQSAALRPVLAAVAWEMIKEHPLSGVGFAQYNKYKKPYHQVEQYELPLQAGLPYMQHNVMLSYATEMGLLGLLAATAMWAGMAWRVYQLWNAPEPAFDQLCVALLLMTVLLNYLVNGLFHDVSIITGANLSLLVAAAMTGRFTPQTAALPRATPQRSFAVPPQLRTES